MQFFRQSLSKLPERCATYVLANHSASLDEAMLPVVVALTSVNCQASALPSKFKTIPAIYACDVLLTLSLGFGDVLR